MNSALYCEPQPESPLRRELNAARGLTLPEFKTARAERVGGPVANHGQGSTTRGDRTRSYKTGRVYADFLVDGQSLSAVVQRKADLISTLGWGPEAYQQSVVDHLLLRAEADLPSGRHGLFVCPECGDLSCGVVGAVIERVEDRITWRDFAYENGWEPPSRNHLGALGPYTFSWAQYEVAIRGGFGVGGFE
jgi:hypothetical protein